MSTEIQRFEFKGAALRTLTDENGEPWFVAKDVCDILGHSNVSMALDRLDDDERSKSNLGRQGETNIVNEAGLYVLVLGSRKPEAHEFKRWVTHDVLPQIRKTGSNRNVPTQKAMDLGLFRIKETAITHSDGHVTINRTAKVTGKGQTYFISRYCPDDHE